MIRYGPCGPYRIFFVPPFSFRAVAAVPVGPARVRRPPGGFPAAPERGARGAPSGPSAPRRPDGALMIHGEAATAARGGAAAAPVWRMAVAPYGSLGQALPTPRFGHLPAKGQPVRNMVETPCGRVSQMRNTQGRAMKRQKNTLWRNVSARPVDGALEASTAM
ncbi:hypothetical protein GCM10010517_18480 [Streptosporangium fragile]|uniref:Uncharacterized protein n=1 Tax=Streptosporangium fragile TaxID=46186 RepID=A0ABN3VU15_9ACTN